MRPLLSWALVNVDNVENRMSFSFEQKGTLMRSAIDDLKTFGAARVEAEVLDTNRFTTNWTTRMIETASQSSADPRTRVSLQRRLARAFNEHRNRSALWIAGETISYAELWSQAVSIAQTLTHLEPDEAVGILAQRSLEAYVGILGSVLRGRAYVPLNMKVPLRRQVTMAATARCVAFISDAKSAARSLELTEALARSGSEITKGASMRRDPWANGLDADLADVDDDRLAYIMFTSGTTGEPKGVAVTRGNLLAYLQAIEDTAPFDPGARCSHLFELSFDLSVHDMFRTWMGGGCMYVISDEEMFDPASFARRNALECWFSVPSVVALAKQRKLAPGCLPTVRLSLFCGEALPTSSAQQWATIAPNSRILNLYGPTEATIALTACEFDSKAHGGLATVPIGRPFSGSAAVAVDEAGAPAQLGETGELWLGGEQTARGYINNAAENEKRFVKASLVGFPYDRWYRTGDLVRVDRAHGLIFIGRRDHQVKVNGYRVELLDIEAALRAAAQCENVAAVAWPVRPDGSAEGVVAFVSGSTLTQPQILDECRKRLPSYMAPRRVIAVDAIPVNANGKIDRNALASTLARADEPLAETCS